jgi:phosphate starvation-inducible PhoH-like protein
MVITGDVTQNDLPKDVSSGLIHAAKLLGEVPGIGFIHFLPEDVVRHEMVQRILASYEEESKRNHKGQRGS